MKFLASRVKFEHLVSRVPEPAHSPHPTWSLTWRLRNDQCLTALSGHSLRRRFPKL